MKAWALRALKEKGFHLPQIGTLFPFSLLFVEALKA